MQKQINELKEQQKQQYTELQKQIIELKEQQQEQYTELKEQGAKLQTEVSKISGILARWSPNNDYASVGSNRSHESQGNSLYAGGSSVQNQE